MRVKQRALNRSDVLSSTVFAIEHIRDALHPSTLAQLVGQGFDACDSRE
jgi:hypothetical protein